MKSPFELYEALLDEWHRLSLDELRRLGIDDEMSCRELEKQYERRVREFYTAVQQTGGSGK